MTVFLSHAPADRETAQALEHVLERRGLFVELDDGETALRPVQSQDVVVSLISQDFVFSPWRLRHEQRALDAWTAGKLVLVKLDHNFAPVGLRDLPFIDASFEAQREFTWMKVADAVRDALKARPATREEDDEAPAPARPAPRSAGGLLGGLSLVLAALPGVFALFASASIWLVNRIGPTPGTFADLIAGVDEFGARFGLPGGATPWLFAAAIAVTLTIFAIFLASVVAPFIVKVLFGHAPSEGEPGRNAPAPAPVSEAVFVSYARANQSLVLPVIEALRAMGRKFWVDQQGGVTVGDGWAGEIVRAIKGSAGVVVMCSPAAFESDHVKREVYLADRYRKRLVPIYVEAAEAPEDFEYFFAGVQSLALFDLAEAERAAAVSQALA